MIVGIIMWPMQLSDRDLSQLDEKDLLNLPEDIYGNFL